MEKIPAYSIWGTIASEVRAGTVAFNGVRAVGNWTIKPLDGNSNVVPAEATAASISFGLQQCNDILPAATCVGNDVSGARATFINGSLVGTILSATPTLAQFDVNVSSSCCFDVSMSSSFLTVSGSEPIRLSVYLDGDPSLEGERFVAQGRSPVPDSREFTVDTGIRAGALGTRFARSGPVELPLEGKAAGLWNFNFSTTANSTVNGDLLLPRLVLQLKTCP